MSRGQFVASVANTHIGTGKRTIAVVPDAYERILAAAAVVLTLVVAIALLRGHAHWGDAPALVWAHLATIAVALILTPIMLLRPRGERRHRRLGYLWVAAMTLTAALSFGIRLSHPGHFSFIHILSAYVLIQAPLTVVSARRHPVARHRWSVRAMVTGALIIAGIFTLRFGRMLGNWLVA